MWYYRRTFDLPAKKSGGYVFLCFEGIDYFARVWLNGVLLGRHEGMFGGPEAEVGKYLHFGGSNEIVVEASLRPYRGDSIVRQIPIRIPTSTPKGLLRILVSDGDSLDRMRRQSPALKAKLDLASTIALLNKEHLNSRLYVSNFGANNIAVYDIDLGKVIAVGEAMWLMKSTRVRSVTPDQIASITSSADRIGTLTGWRIYRAPYFAQMKRHVRSSAPYS